MSADLIMAVAFLGCLVAAVSVAYGIARLDIRLVAAGGAATALIWLACGWVNEDEWTTYRLVDLRLRAVDAVTSETVPDITVSAVATSEKEKPTVHRLPCTVAASDVFAVSVVVEVQMTGSLLGGLRQPAANTKIAEQELQIKAPRYRPLRRKLTQLLPDGWPAVLLSAAPVEVRLDPE